MPKKSQQKIVIDDYHDLGSYGYENVLKLSIKERRFSLRKCALAYGYDYVIKKLTALSNLTHNTQRRFSNRVKKDQEWVSALYKKEKDKLAKKYK
jgi:hypothetical protein